jgi:asparagine synthase (glutamine-hydrolysing)
MGDLCERYWITYNGEIYNYRELRRELESCGAMFRTQTDTEVLLHGYRVWGGDMLPRLDGMFAFAIWDQVERRLWLARDALGIKPLFFASTPDRFLFASEVKAIFAAGVEARPNRNSLPTFLSFGYSAAPATGFEGVQQLPPGCDLTLTTLCSEPRYKRWFRWPYPTTPTNWSRWESADRLRWSLEKSVANQLRSDVPLGAFLSGGLDSSSIVACMDKLGSDPIHTFSMAMQPGSYDESIPAQTVADRFRTQHHAPSVSAGHFDELIQIVRHAEDPIADNSLLPFWLLCKSTSEHVSVALSGDGADELLAGYATYRATELARTYRRLPHWLRHDLLKRIARYLPVSDSKYSLAMFAQRFLRGAELPWPLDHASWRLMLDADYCRWLRSDDWSHNLMRSLGFYTASLADAPPWLDRTQRMLHMDLAFHLPNDMLVKVDRMSMAHGLEVRVPFLGQDVLRTALAIPSQWKRCVGVGKQVLRDAMKSQLPSSTIRRKKAGFVIPIESWLRGPWLPGVRAFLNKSFCEQSGMIRYDGVERMIAEHTSRSADHAYPLFTLLVLSIWWHEWIHPAKRPAGASRLATKVNLRRLPTDTPWGHA